MTGRIIGLLGLAALLLVMMSALVVSPETNEPAPLPDYSACVLSLPRGEVVETGETVQRSSFVTVLFEHITRTALLIDSNGIPVRQSVYRKENWPAFHLSSSAG